MAIFTSVKSGDWNDPTVWDVGAGYPGAADTAALAANHVVTIPVGLAATATVTLALGTTGRTELVINGTLDLAGNMTLSGKNTLTMGPGSTLDLNGFNVAPAATDIRYTFTGTAVSRISIISTTSAGAFTGGAFQVISTWDYVDVTGLADSSFGRTHSLATGFQTYRYCTFDACGQILLEATGTGANAGFLVSHCDFSNPITPASDDLPQIFQSAVLGTQARTVEFCTFSDDAVGSIAAFAYFRCLGATIKKCVFRNVKISSTPNATKADENKFIDNFIANTLDGDVATSGTRGFALFANNYVYYPAADHPFSGPTSDAEDVFSRNIFDGTGGAVGINWLLYGNPAACTITVKNSIFLGVGNAICFTNNGTNSTITFYRNTVYVENSGQQGAGLYFAPVFLSEQLATNVAGAISITHNFMLDPDSEDTRDRMVELVGATADQIDTLNYNVGWSWPDGAEVPPVLYGANVHVTSGEGPNDSAVDPAFIDRTRTLATWDASLGGAGTAANAITELLKMNESDYDDAYSPVAAVRYIREGFKTQAATLRTAADGAPTGACNFHKATRSLTTVTRMNSYAGSRYGL